MPTPPTASIDEPVPAEWPGECVVTRVGGVLYLVHALENLGLPDAFETRWALASQAGPWGSIDLLGRALLGPRFATFADDPLWPALARLTDWSTRGRGGPDPAFRIPADWLQRLDDTGGRFTWTVRDGRLWIWSRQGYLVAHRLWRGGNAAAAVRRELAMLGAPTDARVVRRRDGRVPLLPPSTLPDGCPARLGRLVGAMAPAVRRRLLLALGEADVPAARGAGRIADLLTLRARVYLSSSHVDVVTTLDRADLAIRRAGLDRDPGWRPGFGRVIYFHFS